MKIFRLVFALASGGLYLGRSLLAVDAAAPVAAAVVELGKPELVDGYLKLGFEQLASFTFTPPAFDAAADPTKPPAQTGDEQIPAAVKSWSGKKAVITGFMVPVKMEGGLVTEFLLMRNTMSCCYGAVPAITEWVIVKMKKGVSVVMDVPVSFYGELTVGALFENGYLSGIYFLDGEKMGESK